MQNTQNRNQVLGLHDKKAFATEYPQQINKRNVVIFFVVVGLIILAIILFPIIQQQLLSPEDRIVKMYDEMTNDISSGSAISKVGTSGIRLYDGSEVLKSNSNDAIYIKHYNDDFPLFMLGLISLQDKAELYDKMSSAQKQYRTYYNSAIKSGEVPSEFSKLEIDDAFKGAVGNPIGANDYVYYAIYSRELSDIKATYGVCSAFYSEYGNWGKDTDEDGFPTLDATTVSDKQLRLSDNGASLVITIEPRSLSYPDENNIGRCVRGMLEMPEYIRKEFEDDWLEYANGSSSAKKANSTRTYSWGNLEMKVRHSSEYQYGSNHNKTEYTSEITIYKK